MLSCAAVEQHDDQQAQQGEGDIAVNSPGEGRLGAEPLVLGHHAQRDPPPGQNVRGGGKTVSAADVIPLPPDIVKEHIENRHCRGGDPLAKAQGNSVVLQAGGAQGDDSGHQMEGVSRAQHHRHPAKQVELTHSFVAPDH